MREDLPSVRLNFSFARGGTWELSIINWPSVAITARIMSSSLSN
jgi:hypothetical protein